MMRATFLAEVPLHPSAALRRWIRWQDGKGDAPIPWSMTAADYRDMGGFRLSARMTAAWHEKGGDFQYFRGRLEKVEYDVEAP